MFANFTSSDTMICLITKLLHNLKGSYVCSSKCKQLPVLNAWIIDIRASDHICYDAKNFEILFFFS